MSYIPCKVYVVECVSEGKLQHEFIGFVGGGYLRFQFFQFLTSLMDVYPDYLPI